MPGRADARAARERELALWTEAETRTEDVARWVRADAATHAVMIQWTTSGAFLTAFALLLGAGPTFIALLAGIPLVAKLSQLYASWHIERAGRWRRTALTAAAIGRGAPFLLLPIALLPDALLPAPLRLALVLAVVLVTGLGVAVFDVAWLTWVAELVPPRVRGVFLARRAKLFGLTGVGASLAAAVVLDQWRAGRGAAGAVAPAADGTALAYGVLFAAAALVGLSGLRYLQRVPEPRRTVSRAVGPTMREAFAAPIRDRGFRPLLAFAGGWGFAMGFAGPFFTVWALQGLGLSLLAVTALTASTNLTAAVAQPFYGRLADRFGAKAVLRAGTLLYVLTPLPWLLADAGSPLGAWGLWVPLVLLHLASGLALAAVDLAAMPLVLTLAPTARRASYVASFNAVLAAAQAVAPLLGSGLLAVLLAGGTAPEDAFGLLFVAAAMLRALVGASLGRVEDGAGVSVARMIRVLGRARTRQRHRLATARAARRGLRQGLHRRLGMPALPLQPVFAATYTHLARVAEFVAPECPEVERRTAGDRRQHAARSREQPRERSA